MLYAIIALVVIIVDQWVKFWASGFIPLESTGVEFIPGFVSLVNVHNTGAAFSLFSGSNARIYFIIITAVFTLAVIIALATKFVSGPVARWGLVLMTAGGLSNCIDRVIYGYVQDMFKFDFMPKFPVFNVADIAITVFCFIFVLAIIFERDHRKDEDYDEDEEEEEEDEEPAPKLSRREARKAARRQRELEEEEEEEEEEEPVPAPRRQPARKQAAPRYEEPAPQPAARYEEPAPAPKPAERPAPRRQAAPARDPFAEWEQPAARYEEPAPAPKPVERPAPKPVERPAPKPAEPEPEEFSLEDILAEFK